MPDPTPHGDGVVITPADAVVPGRSSARVVRSTPSAADRVRRSHEQTRHSLRLALSFFAAAAVSAAAGSQRWFVLHLALAGGVTLAISGVSLMLTVTWSAAPAPPDRWTAMQRWCIATGAAVIAGGRALDAPAVVLVAGGLAYLCGLGVLAVLLVRTIRRGTERRFDAAVAGYLLAITAAVIAGTMGAALASGAATRSLRDVHVVVNVLGFIGLVVAATVPFFAATVVRSRMAPRATSRRVLATVTWQGAAVLITATGLALRAPGVAGVGLSAYGVGILTVVSLLPPPTVRQLRWAGPRLVGLWAGCAWWAAAVAASAADAATGRDVLAGRWLLVLVVGAYGQIVWASLAYLLPMLRGGGHELLRAGFTTTRSWLGLAALDAAALSLAVALPATVTAACVTVAVVDTGARLARIGTRPAQREDNTLVTIEQAA
jgi:nitrite reductase (NO-forming)